MHNRISMESDGLGSEESSGRQREEQACGTGEPWQEWMQAFYDCIHEGLAECSLVRAVLAEPRGQLQKSRLSQLPYMGSGDSHGLGSTSPLGPIL